MSFGTMVFLRSTFAQTALLVSPQIGEILDTFETRASTGELIFPGLEARSGGQSGYEIHPTVLTEATAASFDRLRHQIRQDLSLFLPEGRQKVSQVESDDEDIDLNDLDDRDISDVPLAGGWQCLVNVHEPRIFFAEGAHKSICINADQNWIGTGRRNEELTLNGTWQAGQSEVLLDNYGIRISSHGLCGLKDFLGLTAPIDYFSQAGLLLSTLGFENLETSQKIRDMRELGRSQSWCLSSRNNVGGFGIDLSLTIYHGKMAEFSPPELSLSFMPDERTPRPLEGEALRFWNWVCDGLAK